VQKHYQPIDQQHVNMCIAVKMPQTKCYMTSIEGTERRNRTFRGLTSINSTEVVG